jgi:hypothetical protein
MPVQICDGLVGLLCGMRLGVMKELQPELIATHAGAQIYSRHTSHSGACSISQLCPGGCVLAAVSVAAASVAAVSVAAVSVAAVSEAVVSEAAVSVAAVYVAAVVNGGCVCGGCG